MIRQATVWPLQQLHTYTKRSTSLSRKQANRMIYYSVQAWWKTVWLHNSEPIRPDR